MLPSVAMVTTMWGTIDPKIGAAREEELKSSFWLPFLEQGSSYFRFDKSRRSALLIIEKFMDMTKSESEGTLQIQHEMVDQHMTLKDTAAGQQLNAELNESKLEWERELDAIKKDMQAAGLHWGFEKLRIEYEANIAKMEASRAALNVDMAQLSAAKEEELQEELVALAERKREMDQTQYNAQSKRLRSLMGSKRYLQQTLSTGTIAASTAAACVVM